MIDSAKSIRSLNELTQDEHKESVERAFRGEIYAPRLSEYQLNKEVERQLSRRESAKFIFTLIAVYAAGTTGILLNLFGGAK